MKAYVINFGVQNHFWEDAKKSGHVILYEDPYAWDYIATGREDELKERFQSEFEDAYGKQTTKGWLTQWVNYSKLFRDSEPALFIHNKNGILWWAIAGPQSVDLGVKKAPVAYGPDTARRFVGRVCIEGWSNKTRAGKLLQLKDLHPIMETISHTQATIMGISAIRTEYVNALIDDQDLTPWEQMEAWNKAKSKGHKYKKNTNPVRGADEILGEPTQFLVERGNNPAGYVYVLSLKAYPGIYKIGHAEDVEARRKSLQTAVPEELIVEHTVSFNFRQWAENRTHEQFLINRVRGEWFKADLEMIKMKLNWIKSHEDNFINDDGFKLDILSH